MKVNDHGYEHHKHDLFGLEVFRTRPVKDENGEFVYETATMYFHARAYLDHRQRQAEARTRTFSLYEWVPSLVPRSEKGYGIYFYHGEKPLTERPTNKIIADAHAAVEANDPRRLIECGTYRRRKMERYLAYTVADHCTINEPANMYGRYVNVNPCYKEADWRGDINVYRCNCSMCRGSDPSFERSRRRNNRDQMRKVVKLANSGEEGWEDGWNDLKVTTPIRYNTEWC